MNGRVHLPTSAQAIQACILCQWLSNGYQPINVFRFDTQLKAVYIQAGTTDDIAVVILSEGNWRFLDD
jgi:hypothetical protein